MQCLILSQGQEARIEDVTFMQKLRMGKAEAVWLYALEWGDTDIYTQQFLAQSKYKLWTQEAMQMSPHTSQFISKVCCK